MKQRSAVIFGSLTVASLVGYLLTQNSLFLINSAPTSSSSAASTSEATLAERVAKLEAEVNQLRGKRAKLTDPMNQAGFATVSPTATPTATPPATASTNSPTNSPTDSPAPSISVPPTDDSPIYPLTFIPDGSEVDDPFLGKQDARVILMAFSNYSCRTCERFFKETFPELKKSFIDKGQLRFVLRDLPVDRGGIADSFSTVASCAGAQGKYWEAHEAILKRKKTETDPMKVVRSVNGLNTERLTKCANNTRYQREISGDIADAKRLGATGAPSFFIGIREGNHFKGVVLRGAQPLSLFRTQIAKLLPASQK